MLSITSDDRFDFMISNAIRFGYGYRSFEGRRQYYAYYGAPHRNDDYFTTAEISQEEFDEIAREYPEQIHADVEKKGWEFHDKYVEGHPIILEGWNKLLP